MMATRPWPSTPAVTSSAVEAREKPERPSREKNNPISQQI
jgi:hypothetical protein